MSHNATISTLAARTALARIEKDTSSLNTVKEIYSTSSRIFKELYHNFPSVYKVDMKMSVIAFLLSNVAKKAVKVGDITLGEFMQFLAKHKARIAVQMDDFGAFGDLLEVLVRLSFVQKNFRNWKMLSVREYGKADIVSSRLGKVEIGHNGKTLSFGTLYDYMEGNYDSMVYGTFSVEDKEEIYKYCIKGQYEDACNYVKEYMCVWENKYQFQHDMDSLSRGKGITLKGECVQVVYNDSKYKAFQDAIESKRFITLKEYLKK